MRFESGRYAARTLFVVLAMASILSYTTNGFTTYTYESARRADVSKTPAELSDWQLQDGTGKHFGLHEFGDKLLLVNFIFTRCPTICQDLGTRYSRLQTTFPDNEHLGPTLLSVSIEPEFDTPDRLQQYRRRYGGHAGSWRVARPRDSAALQQLIDDTSIRVIADNWGGYAHSDSVHVIKEGQLVRILDWDSDELTRLVSSSNR